MEERHDGMCVLNCRGYPREVAIMHGYRYLGILDRKNDSKRGGGVRQVLELYSELAVALRSLHYFFCCVTTGGEGLSHEYLFFFWLVFADFFFWRNYSMPFFYLLFWFFFWLCRAVCRAVMCCDGYVSLIEVYQMSREWIG